MDTNTHDNRPSRGQPGRPACAHCGEGPTLHIEPDWDLIGRPLQPTNTEAMHALDASSRPGPCLACGEWVSLARSVPAERHADGACGRLCDACHAAAMGRPLPGLFE